MIKSSQHSDTKNTDFIIYFKNNYFNKLGKRAESFLKLFELCIQRDVKIIIETGTLGNKDNWFYEGNSTFLFGCYAKTFNATVYTVDISDKNLGVCREATEDFNQHIKYILEDSVKFLSSFTERIDLLYLDSFDYFPPMEIVSQVHNINEFKAAEKYLHSNSIVCIDDCQLRNGGKGGFTIPYMIRRDWELVYEGYQCILIKKGSRQIS